MSTTTIDVKLAISGTSRWPYHTARVLGPRAQAQPGELVVPLCLRVDDALLRRRTAAVRIDIPTPDAPAANIAGERCRA